MPQVFEQSLFLFSYKTLPLRPPLNALRWFAADDHAPQLHCWAVPHQLPRGFLQVWRLLRQLHHVRHLHPTLHGHLSGAVHSEFRCIPSIRLFLLRANLCLPCLRFLWGSWGEMAGWWWSLPPLRSEQSFFPVVGQRLRRRPGVPGRQRRFLRITEQGGGHRLQLGLLRLRPRVPIRRIRRLHADRDVRLI